MRILRPRKVSQKQSQIQKEKAECETGKRVKKTIIKKSSSQKINSKKFKCPFCNRTCLTFCSLNIHIRTHTGEKPFTCKQCDFHAASSGNLSTHNKRYHESKNALYKCQFCKFRTVAPSFLEKHVRIHTGEKPYACNQCDFRCAQKVGVEHHQRIHVGKKLFECKLCQFKAFYKSNVTDHTKSHTNEKPLKCQYCDFRTAYRSYLKRHEMVHRGDKPFQCKYCNYRAHRPDFIKRHESNHTGNKHLECKFCSFRTADSSTLSKHKKSCH